MSVARKLFRLFKSINEYQKLIKFLDSCSDGMAKLVLGILTRLGLFFFWLFDNLQVLTKINFIKGNDATYKKYGMLGWFVSLVATIVSSILDLMRLYEQVADDTASIERLKAKGEEGKERLQMRWKARAITKAQIFAAYLTIIKCLGDLITASAGSGIAKKLFKRTPNEGMMGIGGSVSAVISLYNVWPKKK